MKTDWINAYSENKVQKFQAGGPMAPEAGMAPEAAPAGGAPDLEGMLAEYAQTRDPQLAVAICDMLVEMIASQGGGAEAPAGGGGEMAPPMAKQGTKMSKAPVFK